jgi:hypothetical protein
MITFFTMPKAFRGHAKVVQYNAFESWVRLNPRPEIILMGKEDGMKAAALKFGCELKNIRRHKGRGVPLVNYAFRAAQMMMKTDLLCMSNPDVIFMDDFMPTVKLVASRLERFLIIGRKWDLLIIEPLNFHGNWQKELRKRVAKEGVLHSSYGLDYFVFTPKLYGGLPDFYVGHRGWDNYLMWYVLKRDIPVVDATEAIMAIHQKNLHPKPASDELIRHNLALAGEAGTWGRTEYATWEVTKEGELKKR